MTSCVTLNTLLPSNIFQRTFLTEKTLLLMVMKMMEITLRKVTMFA